MDASDDEIVIVKVENKKVTKRTSNGGSSKAQKKQKLETDGKTDVILLSSSPLGNTDSSENEDGSRSKKKDKMKASSSEGMTRDGPVVIGDVVECRSQTVTCIRDDLEIVEQEMLDHALALSLMQEEMDGYAKRKTGGQDTPSDEIILPPVDNILRNTGKSPTTHASSSSSELTEVSKNQTDGLSGEHSPSTSVASTRSPSTDLADKDVEFPKYWQPMGETASNSKSYELYMVLPGSEEFQAIAQCFHRKPLVIYSVKRIQNLHFLKRYNLEKKLIMDTRGSGFNLNEQRLFHTSSANPDDICEQGLDLRLSNGGSFGNGIYFSDDILKCHGYWRHSFQPALMFQCRVILGDIKEYPPNVRDVHLRREPEKATRSPGEQRYYDSVKGNVTGRNEYVVYNAYRILPEYMIEYTYTSTQKQLPRKKAVVAAVPAYVRPVPPPSIVPIAPTQDPRYIQILNMMQNKNKRSH